MNVDRLGGSKLGHVGQLIATTHNPLRPTACSVSLNWPRRAGSGPDQVPCYDPGNLGPIVLE